MGDARTAKIDDPLAKRLRPERVNYATGVMLDAQDFLDEQTYHRARLARVLQCALGMGTLVGLRVKAPEANDPELRLRVEPGVAIDRLGRLIEIGGLQCIRLRKWYDDVEPSDLVLSMSGDFVVADVFLSAHTCGQAKTPAFAAGPFDALDAVIPARLEDCFELKLVPRLEEKPGVPENFWKKDAADPLEQIMATQLENADALLPLVEHVENTDYTAVLLARVKIPATVVGGQARPVLGDPAKIEADNKVRPFIFVAGKWLGSPAKKAA